MYVAKNHGVSSASRQVALIKKNPLGLLITYSPDGGITANHFPFIVDRDETTDEIKLRAHVPKRLGPQIEALKAGSPCMVVFQGPDAYITPSWYIETKPTTHKTVPTWDFATVHCHGVPKLHDSSQPDGDAFLSTQINDLTAQMEKSIPEKDEWTVSEAPENYIRLLKRTLYGLEIEVSRTEAKWKMSQDKPAKDIDGVQAGLRTQGEHGCIVADIVQESVEYVQSGAGT